MENQLYNCVLGGSYEHALHLTKKLLDVNDGDQTVCEVVNRLLREGVKNVLGYAYKLWNCGHKEVIISYFPVSFKLLLNEDYVKISNKADGFPLKLIFTEGLWKAYGDAHDKTSHNLIWKFIPIWESNMLYFKVSNERRRLFMELNKDADSVGDHRVHASGEANTDRHQWYLQPVMLEGQLLFYIYNRYFSRGLKLGKWVNPDGDHIAWSHNSHVHGNPKEFGWIIETW